jgi:hypothetical protein
MGAPLPGAPPCILQRDFPFTTGDWHSFPLGVRARHRSACFTRDPLCLGLFLIFMTPPTPGGDSTYDGLSALVDVDVLNGDMLLSPATMAVQSLH